MTRELFADIQMARFDDIIYIKLLIVIYRTYATFDARAMIAAREALRCSIYLTFAIKFGA